VENLVRADLNQLDENFAWTLTPLDIFAPDDDHKNITLRIEITDRTKTIDLKFVAKLTDKIAKTAQNKLHAKLI
jgi:phenylalanyl-tRNA synthetase beta subunit